MVLPRMVAHDLLTMRCGKDGTFGRDLCVIVAVWLRHFLGRFLGVFSQPKVPFPHNFAASRDCDITKQVGVGLADQHLCQTYTAIFSGSLEADMEPAAAIPKVIDGMLQ